jgi:N-methylhydantoinase A
MYGHSNTAGPVEFVNLRTIHVHRPDERENPPRESASATAPKPVAHREAYFDGGFVKTPVYDRKHLSVGQEIEGPAIVEQADTTLIIYPKQRAQLREDRSILVDVPHE